MEQRHRHQRCPFRNRPTERPQRRPRDSDDHVESGIWKRVNASWTTIYGTPRSDERLTDRWLTRPTISEGDKAGMAAGLRVQRFWRTIQARRMINEADGRGNPRGSEKLEWTRNKFEVVKGRIISRWVSRVKRDLSALQPSTPSRDRVTRNSPRGGYIASV